MHPKIWKASGHLDTFADPMTMCKDCKKLMRADQVKDIYADQRKKPQPKVAGAEFFCPYCGGELTEPKPFNLMFKTVVGPIDDPSNVAYLRPETAQAIFAQFKTVCEVSYADIPNLGGATVRVAALDDQIVGFVDVEVHGPRTDEDRTGPGEDGVNLNDAGAVDSD